MLKTGVVFAAACVCGLLLSEAVVRLSGRDPGQIWEPHPVLGWKPVPGAQTIWTQEGHGRVTINRAGFRDRERLREKPPHGYRIAVLGDSQTEAVQVDLEETFCAVLEARLASAGYRVEVLNFGVSGYSPVQEWLLFREEAAEFDPDLVIQALFLDNDVAGVDPELTVSSGGVPLVAFDGAIPRFDLSRARDSFDAYHREPKRSLRQRLATYRLLSQLRSRLALGARASATGGVPTRYQLYARPLGSRWESAWDVMEHVILHLARDVRTRGGEFLLLSVPAAQVVSPRSWRNVVAQHPAMREMRWDLEGPEERLARFAANHELPLVQPYRSWARLMREAPDPPFYFGDVGHLTPRGHRQMASTLFPVVEAQLRRHEELRGDVAPAGTASRNSDLQPIGNELEPDSQRARAVTPSGTSPENRAPAPTS